MQDLELISLISFLLFISLFMNGPKVVRVVEKVRVNRVVDVVSMVEVTGMVKDTSL